MANMRERGTRHQYLAAAIVAACSLYDRCKLFSWQEQGFVSGTGSPP